MKEGIHIVNFGGLSNITVSVNSYTLLIGPQASGKSIVARLLYFFKGVISLNHFSLEQGENGSILSEIENRFCRLFPRENWPKGDFVIEYFQNDLSFVVKSTSGTLEVSFPDEILDAMKSYNSKYLEAKKEFEKKGSELQRSVAGVLARLSAKQAYWTTLSKHDVIIGNQVFIVAGRSFFSEINSSIFELNAREVAIEPILLESMSVLALAKQNMEWDSDNEDKIVQEYISSVLRAKYVRENKKDWLVHSKGRRVEIQYASSGQQETLPLLLLLDYVRKQVLSRFRSKRDTTTIYIEEPEAHIFPPSQKLIVELISYICNKSSGRIQVVLTTHSPYVMASFNNLIEAGNVIAADARKKEAVEKIVGYDTYVSFDSVNAYSLVDGDSQPIMDKEEKLIDASALDSISDSIYQSFNQLLSL